jgi:hypothetical protein
VTARPWTSGNLCGCAVLCGSVLLPKAVAAQIAPPAPVTIEVGEWQLAPVFQVRTRGEYRRDLDDDDRGQLATRVRVGVDADRGPVRVCVVLEDARTIALVATANPVEGPEASAFTGAYEASVEAQNGAFHPSFVRIGRQPVVWGEGRLLGVSDWTPAGRSLDAVRGRLVVGDGAVEALAAVLEDVPVAAIEPPSAYGELFGARGEWTFDPLFAVEAYALARLAQANPSDASSSLEGTIQGQTYAGSLRFWGDGSGWTWGAEGSYELGHVDVLSAARSAWAASGHVARAFDTALLQPNVRVGAAYASGASAGSGPGAAYRAFDPLLADVHAWHGAMDVFTASNEEEVSARVGAVPFADGSAAIEYRFARLAQASGEWRSDNLVSLGQKVGGSADLGHEIDASLAWSPWSGVVLDAGYSIFVLGDGAREILGPAAAKTSHFAFAQASVTF